MVSTLDPRNARKTDVLAAVALAAVALMAGCKGSSSGSPIGAGDVLDARDERGALVTLRIDAVENEQYRYYLRLNPVASLLDAYRGILLAGEWPPAEPLLWIGLASLGGIYAGLRFMARNDWNYPKVV